MANIRRTNPECAGRLVSLRLCPELLGRVDKLRSASGLSRSEILRVWIRRCLGGVVIPESPPLTESGLTGSEYIISEEVSDGSVE